MVEQADSDTIRYGGLTGSLGFLLRLSQLASFRDFYDELGPLGIRPGEISVLTVIGLNPGIRQGVLARHLMIKRAHMTKVVRALDDAGLIARRVPADDKRAVELSLTAKGQARMREVHAPFAAHEKASTGPLTAREEAELKRLLRKYLDLPAPDGEGSR
ncbi:MAG: MarR family transcriptional regulator [Roseivivax sp.]|nr:MarR family transcriptional regulator [Roseivivax sp.]